MQTNIIKDLKKVFALSDMPDEHLQWIAERVEYHEFNDGELVVKKGDPTDMMWMISEGSLDFYMDVKGQQVHYVNIQNDLTRGGVTGLLPYSRLKEIPGYGYASGKLKAYTLHKKYFKELEQLNPELIQKLIGYMTERARTFATVKLQHEKVSALGKLAAGIAHEMNNPASAIHRISSELAKRLDENFRLTEQLLTHKITAERIKSIREMVESKNSNNRVKLGSIERMQKEDEITDWLEKNGLDKNHISCYSFVESGITSEDLENIRNGAETDVFPDMLYWIENLLISKRIIKDLGEASMRISDLVGAIKSHVHLDQTNELQPTDLNRDIENTLTLMSYKLSEKNITVKKLFDENLPPVPAYVNELNQVWTNIIDNAVYAIEKDGELTIETSSDSKNIYVKIIDNGTGIPPEIISRIFDPFFTTKKVGEGTGIGLDLVYRIIKHHNGDISVNSRAGRTEFTICIPITDPRIR